MFEFRVSDPVPVREAIPVPAVTCTSHEGCFPVPGYRSPPRGFGAGQRHGGAHRPFAILALLLLCSAVLGGCASLGSREAAPVTVPEIIQLSQQGVSAEQIIARMSRSGTVYRLQASQLASLQRQGVANSVIDYMQQTYLDAVRQRQERSDLGYWSEVDGWWYGGGPWGWLDADREYHAARDTD